jgi:hypothetical protein
MLTGKPTFQDPELSPNTLQMVLSIRRCVLALVCYVCNALAALQDHEHIQAKEIAPPPVVMHNVSSRSFYTWLLLILLFV